MTRFIVALAAVLLAVPAAAQEWWEAETAHFIVKSRDSEAETRKFAEELERYDNALRVLQNLPVNQEVSPANKVTIFRFGDIGDIGRLAGSSGVAGFYIPRAGASVAFVPAREERRRAGSVVRQDARTALDGMSVLKHEYAHHFMMQYFPGAYPRWYVEGYAETVATMRLYDDGRFHIGDPPQYRSSLVMRMPGFRSREMLDANHELTGFDAYRHYGTGWLLTHYLNFSEEGEPKLRAYLAALAAGEDSLTAAERILGNLDQLDRKLSAYRRGAFPGKEILPPNYVAPVANMRRIGADEVAFMQQKMELWRGIEKKDAPRIQERVRAGLASYPNSVEGYLLLAEASYDAEDYDSAEAAAARAVELDPNSTRGWLYAGMTANRKAKDTPAEASDLVTEARKSFARAAELDSTDPRPQVGYYRTYFDQGQEAPEAALIALESAYEHAGSDVEYRLLLGRQLLSENRFADARTVIMPVAFQGHATGEADADKDDPTPTRLLRAMEAQDAPGAIAMIDRMLDPEDKDEEGKSA